MEHLKNFMPYKDEECEQQIEVIAEHPAFKNETIRIMPDAHKGLGCVIGFTSTFSDKVIVGTIGVDIGCRVSMYETPFHWGDVDAMDKKFLTEFDTVIHQKVPAGLGVIRQTQHKYSREFDSRLHDLKCFNALRKIRNLEKSMGSIGSGNHFCELNKAPTHDAVFLTIHTGSRNLGQQVARIYQEKAINNCKNNPAEIAAIVERLKSEGRQQEIQSAIAEYKSHSDKNLPKDLCYIEGQDLEDYLNDIQICCEWSYWNHATIIDEIMSAYGEHFNDTKLITCMHNYIDVDNRMIRKGAISAQTGEQCLIPMNMRDGICVMIGKGNPDWNYSLPHGCGRKMSRHEAKENLDIYDYQYEMEDVFSTCVSEDTIDESPMVYKDPEDVLEIAAANGRNAGIYKSVYNFKGV